MKKTIIVIYVGTIAVLLISVAFYWGYYSKPERFPSNDELITEVNSLYSPSGIKVVQKKIPVDAKHVIVPFISQDNRYGLSYWEWQNTKWENVGIDLAGQPRIWMFNREDPSSYVIAWNIHPDDHLNQMKFYLIGNRNFFVSDGIEHYQPKVQMVKTISLGTASYGVIKLPNEWVLVMDSMNKLNSAKQVNLMFNDGLQQNGLTFGWKPSFKNKNSGILGKSMSGNGFSRGIGEIEYINLLDESEIE